MFRFLWKEDDSGKAVSTRKNKKYWYYGTH